MEPKHAYIYSIQKTEPYPSYKGQVKHRVALEVNAGVGLIA